MKEAMYYENAGAFVSCRLCPHNCLIGKNKPGLCKARLYLDDKLTAAGYGRVSALGLDPIEKKPLRNFYPGSWILSLGSYGCNMRCAFCQNDAISQNRVLIDFPKRTETGYYTPEEILRKAYGQPKNIGIAFTYNEPLINIEYVMETALLFKASGQKVVLVTNGLINAEPLDDLLPMVDALNIDVKGFSKAIYKKLGGDLDTVKYTVQTAAARCHVEVTALIVPGENDSPEEMESLTDWLAAVNPHIPLHISRFFPRYLMREKPATPIETLNEMSAIARRRMRHVYLGNA